MKKRLISEFISLMMVIGCVTLPASAIATESPSTLTINNAEVLDVTFDTVTDSTILNEDQFQNNLKENYSEAILPIIDDKAAPAKTFNNTSLLTNAQLDLGTNPFGNLTATLSQDQVHILLFQLTESKILFSKMTSSNSAYAYQIYKVNNDGTLTPYSNAVLSGKQINGTIPSGQYAFVVANTGSSYGNSYNLFMNTATPNPSNASSISLVSLSSSYKHVTVQVITTSGNMVVYCDGVRVIDESSPNLLDWERVLDLSWSSGYNYNKHEIYNAVVSGISGVGTYTSDYVTSNNAVILYLDVGTGYMYNESKRNWDTGEHIFHFYDPARNTTPRTLNAYDIANYNCRLIFDLNTGRPIDFWSWLNWYYATGTEDANFTLNGD